MYQKLTFSLVASAFLSCSVFAGEVESLLTLYNSPTTKMTIAVVRQSNSKVKLFTCQKAYTGDLRDFAKALRFFNEGLKSVFKKRINCLNYQKQMNGKIKAVKDPSGRVARWVLTVPKVSRYQFDILSDLSVWTIEAHRGINGISPNSSVLLTGVRISHEALNNPKISTYRDTFRLSGMAKLNFSKIK